MSIIQSIIHDHHSSLYGPSESSKSNYNIHLAITSFFNQNNRLTLIVLIIVFVLSFLLVSLLCGAVLARNASIIFSEFRSFSSSSSLSTCFSCGFFLCFIDSSLRGIFLEEESLLLLPAENEKYNVKHSFSHSHDFLYVIN